MTFDAVAFLEGLVGGEPVRSAGDVGSGRAVRDPLDALDLAGIRPADLPEPWRELYEERAAIREYDGGQAREHAEAEALGEVVAMMRTAERERAALTGPTPKPTPKPTAQPRLPDGQGPATRPQAGLFLDDYCRDPAEWAKR